MKRVWLLGLAASIALNGAGLTWAQSSSELPRYRISRKIAGSRYLRAERATNQAEPVIRIQTAQPAEMTQNEERVFFAAEQTSAETRNSAAELETPNIMAGVSTESEPEIEKGELNLTTPSGRPEEETSLMPVPLKEALQKAPSKAAEPITSTPQNQAARRTKQIVKTGDAQNMATSSTQQPNTAKPVSSEKKLASSEPSSPTVAAAKNAGGVSEKAQKQALSHLNKASALGRRGRLKEAFAEYQRALELNPHLADAHVGISAVYGQMGKWAEAIDALKKALSTPDDFALPSNLLNAKFNLTASYCMNGQKEEAYTLFESELEGKHPHAKSLLKLMESKCPVSQPQSTSESQ